MPFIEQERTIHLHIGAHGRSTKVGGHEYDVYMLRLLCIMFKLRYLVKEYHELDVST